MHTFKVYTNVDHMIKLTGVDLVMGCICPRKDPVNVLQAHNPLYDEDAQDGASAIGGEEQPEYVSGLKDRGAKFSTTYPPGSKLQPAGIFSYLPEDYTKPKLLISGNSFADDTAATVKEFFTNEILKRRRTVDNHLKAFKVSLGKDINDPLPACFVAWKNRLFPGWEVPKNSCFCFKISISNNQGPLLQSICANKARDSLTPELVNTDTHMNNLLAACLGFLQQKDNLKHKLEELNVQLLYVEACTRTTDTIIEELQSLPTEVDRFADEIHILMKNIHAALDSYGMKKTGGKAVVSYPDPTQLTYWVGSGHETRRQTGVDTWC